MSSLLLCLFVLSTSYAFIAYDCSHNNMNFTKIDMSKVGICDTNEEKITSLTEEMQLVQLSTDFEIDVYSCLVEVNRMVSHCGMHSHIGHVTFGYGSYIKKLGRNDCLKAINDKYLSFNHLGGKNMIFQNILPGHSYNQHQTFAGWTDNEGNCGSSYYADPLGSWKDVVVTGQVKLTIRKDKGVVVSTSNKLHFKNGIVCKYSLLECENMEYGESYWERLPEDSCDKVLHTVLYQGPATITKTNNNKSESNTKERYINGIISVSSDDILFSLVITGTYSKCNIEAYTTEHPKLIIVRKSGSSFYYTFTKQKKVEGLDMLTYTNSKFVYIERNIKSNMENLYKSVKSQRCIIEQTTLRTQLSVAAIDANEFAYLYKQQPGYTGTVLGEVIYLTKCQPVPVTYNKTKRCFHELPVIYNGKQYFMTPRLHLLQLHGREVTCNPLFTSNYQIEGTWYSISTSLTDVIPPEILKPVDKNDWTYKSPKTLANNGIYTPEDLEQLRTHIMYGPEKDAITNVLIRGFTEQYPSLQGGSIKYLIDEDTINDMSSHIANKLWGWFTVFGNISAGVFGVLLILRIIKWLIDTIIHGTALYELYGMSVWLLGSIWDSLTVCLIHRATQKSTSVNGKNINSDDDLILKELITCKPENSIESPSAPIHNGSLYPKIYNAPTE
uniref:Glycoprotein n=1 Tax=Neuropteran chu-related virus OKIAV150 TaxID=2792594 RepID=A0A7T0M3N9_9VIRU|nr:glycoprotein [Neuropteran chu-related virus OKIAV150]